jgi:hydrogenase nickel incorporation protein HypA/HybF
MRTGLRRCPARSYNRALVSCTERPAPQSAGAPSRTSSAVVGTHMHELSIAIDLIELASAEMARIKPARLVAVRVRVGPLSGIVAEALRFSFDAAAAGTTIEGARLHIDEMPVTVWCSACETERELRDLTRRRCPVCQSATPRVTGGRELELVHLEIRDA